MIVRLATKGVAASAILSFVLSIGCESAKTVVPLTKINPAAAAAKAIELYDANKDGKISGVELDKVPGIKAGLDMLGSDVSKEVTAEQISARIQKWADDKNGIVPVLCNVARNGIPVADAEIKFVPDPFLSDYLTRTGVGKTDANGIATVSLPKEPESDMPPGVPPGFYRVEITKTGENIPAQYNVATTFGQEISSDGALKHALAGKKMLFNMTY